MGVASKSMRRCNLPEKSFIICLFQFFCLLFHNISQVLDMDIFCVRIHWDTSAC